MRVTLKIDDSVLKKRLAKLAGAQRRMDAEVVKIAREHAEGAKARWPRKTGRTGNSIKARGPTIVGTASDIRHIWLRGPGKSAWQHLVVDRAIILRKGYIARVKRAGLGKTGNG